MVIQKKIDSHVHCSRKRCERKEKNPRNPEDCYVADPAEIIEHLKEQGIKRGILMSSGEAKGMLSCNNTDCMEIVKEYPDFFSWMCNLDLECQDTVAERLTAYKAKGAVGIGELSINQWMNGPFLTTVFAAAEKLQLPVTIHMSPEPGFSYGVCDRAGLPLLEETLMKFPNLKLLGHSQVFWMELSKDCPRDDNKARSGMGRGPVVEGGRVEVLMRKYPNLYGDLSAYSGSCAILRDEAYGLKFLKEFSNRLLFATDTVNRHQTFPLGKFLDECLLDGRLEYEEWENICYKNAERLFGLQ